MNARVAMIVVFALVARAEAQPRPAVLDRVGLDERVGERVPLSLAFLDTSGHRVELGTQFDNKHPVLLVLTYVRCKMLCSLVLHGAMEAVRELPLELGRDYRVVMVSIDPHEDAASAAARRRDILRAIGKRDDAAWTYLVGAESSIRALAESLGFHYKVDARTEQIAHPAVIFVLTPNGTIAHYLQGIQFSPAELAAALRGAAANQLSAKAIAGTVLSCFQFDPALRARREQLDTYLRVGGATVMLALGSTVVLLLVWERRRRRPR